MIHSTSSVMTIRRYQSIITSKVSISISSRYTDWRILKNIIELYDLNLQRKRQLTDIYDQFVLD